MKRKLVAMALILTMAFAGCGNSDTQQAQETVAQTSEESQAQETAAQASEESKTEKSQAQETAAQTSEEGKTEKSQAQEKAAQTSEESKTEESQTEAESKETQTETEASAKNAKEDAETAETEEKVEPEEYTVTSFTDAKVMYASNPVNVRKGPTTDYERVGWLNRGQEVSVTGQADTGWYEIAYGEEKAYVSDKYLQDEKPADPVPQQAEATSQPTQQVQAVTEVRNVAGVILVGDSRFVQMQGSVGANGCTWIAENSKGYKWLNETAIARIDGCVGKGSKILINLGVNDPGNVNNYLTLINAKAAEWVSRGATVYYASVNPVWENPYVTEEQVHSFNSQMQGGLSGNVHWIDSHSYLESIGYKLVDGLHYNAETYQNLYAYFMSCL